MKAKRHLIVFAAILCLTGSLVFPQKDPKTLKFADIEFKPQKPSLLAISKGIDLYSIENREFPTISAFLIIKTGSLSDPKGKEGLANLTMNMMKSGGTINLSPEQVEEKLDFLGSTLGCSARPEYSVVNLWTLKKNFDESWKILADILYNPLFDKDRFETQKKMELEQIRRRWDSPLSVGFILFQDLVYGKGFPDVRRTTTESIESITLDEVKAFYKENIKDKELIIGFTGDFETPVVSALLKETFKDWRTVPSAVPSLPKAKLAAKPGLYLIDKPDMTQAVICLGHLGINRLDPDNVEIAIMNFIYGSGGFSSRLMREVRSNRGLAYSTFGYVSGDRDLGIFMSACMTKSESVAVATNLIQDIMVDMTKNSVTSEELETAKKYEQNAFVHRFDSPLAVLRQSVSLKLDGFPDDYLETYIPRIKKVDVAKVLAMAKRTMRPEELVILVVGKKADILDMLKALNMGEITELPLPKE